MVIPLPEDPLAALALQMHLTVLWFLLPIVALVLATAAWGWRRVRVLDHEAASAYAPLDVHVMRRVDLARDALELIRTGEELGISSESATNFHAARSATLREASELLQGPLQNDKLDRMLHAIHQLDRAWIDLQQISKADSEQLRDLNTEWNLAATRFDAGIETFLLTLEGLNRFARSPLGRVVFLLQRRRPFDLIDQRSGTS